MFKVGDEVQFLCGLTKYVVIEVPEGLDVILSGEGGAMYRVAKSELEVINKQKNFFSIKQGQIEAAARFIIANNKYMHHHTVDSMSAKIKNYIKEMIDKINSGKESYYCATAGFVITINLEDDNYYVVEVLVSPDVSSDEEFVNVEEII